MRPHFFIDCAHQRGPALRRSAELLFAASHQSVLASTSFQVKK